MLIDRPQITETSKIVNVSIDSGTSDPSNPDVGELFYRTDLDALRIFTGASAWFSMKPLDASGNIDLGSGDVTADVITATGQFTGSGTGLTGTASSLNIGGNAATATVLQTARTIAISGGATGTATSFNGSANITIPVTDLNATNLTAGTVPAARLSGTYTITVAGNASTATTLQAARTIGLSGVTATAQSFDGSANITIPVTDVPASLLSGTIAAARLSGTYAINISGSAATLTTPRTINGVAFDGSANITVTAAAGTLTGTTLNPTVTASSLTSVGTLSSLVVGGAAQFNSTVLLSADPTLALQAATKQYVDNVVANGVSWKQAVRAATTANITLSGAQTVDGVALNVGDRVLVKNQTPDADAGAFLGRTRNAANGIYNVASGAWTRVADADSATELPSAAVFVSEGTTQADIAYVQIVDSVTVNSTPLAFVQFSTAGGGVAGNGITIAGTTISVNADTVNDFTFSPPQLQLKQVAGNIGTFGSSASVPTVTVDSKGRVTAAASAIGITSANTASTVVSRDASGNFIAGTITASLTGAASLNVLKAGDTMTGALVVNSGASLPLSLRTSSSGPWAIELLRTDTSFSSKAYNNGTQWHFEHRPSFAGNTPLDSANYNTYVPTLTGTGASGTWAISISGNAATATLANNTSSISSAVGGSYTWTGTQNFLSGNSVGVATQAGTLVAFGNSAGTNAAVMSFHRPGAYAINMGLDTDNVFRIGGWSDGLNVYRAQFYASGSLRITGALYPSNGSAYMQTSTGTYGTMEFGGQSNNGYFGLYYPGSASTYGGMFDTSGNGGDYDTSTGWHFYWNRANVCLGIGGSTTAAGYAAYTNGNHYVAGSLYATGDVTAFSDRRIKTDIEPIYNALAKVEGLRGVSYRRVDTGDYQIGFIAQEVEEVVPEVVKTDHDGMKGVTYGNMVALLVEAVKELKAEVNALKAQLAAKDAE